MEKKSSRKEIRSEGNVAGLGNRPVRSEVMTLTSEPPDSHWRAVHLRMISRPLKASSLDFWLTVDQTCTVYIGLSFLCREMPLLKEPHVTIGQYTLVKRTNISSLVKRLTCCLGEHAPERELEFQLAPYGRGYNWELEADTEMYWVLRRMRGVAQDFGLEATWAPSFHVTWH